MYLYEIKRRRNGRCVGNDFAQNIDDECVYIYIRGSDEGAHAIDPL